MIAIGIALTCLRLLLAAAEHAIRLSDAESLRARGQKRRGAARAAFFAAHPEHLWATARPLGRLATLGATTAFSLALPHPAWALALMLPVVFVTAELLPRSLLPGRAERVAPWLGTPLKSLYLLFWPLVALVSALSRRLGHVAPEDRPAPTREDLQLLVDQERTVSDLRVDEREMISRIFEFSHLTATDSMVPLKEVCALSVDAKLKDAVALVSREGFSRLPVYRDRLDEVVGVLHHMDLLRAHSPDQPVGELMRPPLFVPETQEIDDILVILQRRAASAAVVVDEFGKAVGLLTLEDILEEIVGEIDDEFDPNVRLWRAAPEGYVVTGRASREQVEKVFQVSLDADEGVETVAGFVLHKLKRIPQVGERLDLGGGVTLVVHQATERAIEELLLLGPVRPHEH